MFNISDDYLERETLVEWVAVQDLFVAPYARPISQGKVNRMISRGFAEDALGCIIGSMRPDGKIAILDGGHRVSACRMLGITHVVCKVFIDKTYEEEAELCDKLNTVNRTTALDRFRFRLEWRDPKALTIQQILAKHGMSIAVNGKGAGAITSVSAIDKLFEEQGANGLHNVVNILHRAWGHEKRAWIYKMIDGMRQFWLRYHTEVDRDRLVDRLRLTTPEHVLAMAGVLPIKTASHGTLIGRTLVEHYNSGLRSRRLSDWIDHPGVDIEGKSKPPKDEQEEDETDA